MAKRIIWSKRAQSDRKQILQFWIEHNKSKTYSIKLNHLFRGGASLLAVHPTIGIQTDYETVRSKLVRDYRIFYEIKGESIHVLTIWDCQRDLTNIKL